MSSHNVAQKDVNATACILRELKYQTHLQKIANSQISEALWPIIFQGSGCEQDKWNVAMHSL